MKPGIKILEDIIGSGDEVQTGDRIEIQYDLYLNRGEVIQSNFRCEVVLGERHTIAGLNHGIEGMRVGGRRKFKAGPHLCYGSGGVPPAGIPPDAVLVFDLKLLGRAATSVV